MHKTDYSKKIEEMSKEELKVQLSNINNFMKWFHIVITWFIMIAVIVFLTHLVSVAVQALYQLKNPRDFTFPVKYKYLPFALVSMIFAIGMCIKKYFNLDYKFLNYEKYDFKFIATLAILNTLALFILFGFAEQYKSLLSSCSLLFSGSFFEKEIIVKGGLKLSRFSFANFISKIILLPIALEVLLRGFFFDQLRDEFTKKGALIISSLAITVFAGIAMNFGLFAFALLFINNLIYAYCYDKTKVIWYPIILHAINNFLWFFINILTAEYLILFSIVIIIILTAIFFIFKLSLKNKTIA